MKSTFMRGLWGQIFLPYAIGYFLSYLLRTVNAVMAPELSQSLGISAAELGLLTSTYLVAFALMQLPLGVALDRYGARHVQVVLLIISAVGCALFALGQTFFQLAIARAVIGIGVSGCLLAAYKTFSQWFPTRQHASANAAIMAAGGLGALASSSPFNFLMSVVGWRWVFFGLALFSLVASWFIFKMPEKKIVSSHISVFKQIVELKKIFKNRSFWRFVPMAATMNGGFLAIQGLWAFPWLTTVGGLGRDQAAFCLLLLNLTLMIGYGSFATLLGRLLSKGMTLTHLIVIGAAIFQSVTLALILNVWSGYVLWALLGLAHAATNLTYAHHASRYESALSARTNACLNLGVLIGGFALQWGFGIVVDMAQDEGMSQSAAMTLSWSVLLAFQFVSVLWFVVSSRWEKAGKILS